MKKLFAILLILTLSVTALCGCKEIMPKLEELEIYQSLMNTIDENDNLEQIIDSFAKLMEPLMDDSDNRYQYETIAYDVDGAHYLKVHLASQFKIPVYTETLQLNLVLIFAVDEDLTAYEENKWVDHDFDAFIEYIKGTDVFSKLMGKTVDSYNVTIEKAK